MLTVQESLYAHFRSLLERLVHDFDSGQPAVHRKRLVDGCNHSGHQTFDTVLPYSIRLQSVPVRIDKCDQFRIPVHDHRLDDIR